MHRKSLVLSLATLACLAAPALAQEPVKAAPQKSLMDGVFAVAIGLVTAVIAIFISLTLAMHAVKKAIEMFDKATAGIDEWAELSKGNVAVGIVLASMIYSVGSVISDSVEGLTKAIMVPSLSWAFLLSVVIGLINLLIGIWVATTVVGFAIKALDKATEKIDEMKEVAKGNVAVAVMIAGVLLAVSNVVGSAVKGLSEILNITHLAKQFGWA